MARKLLRTLALGAVCAAAVTSASLAQQPVTRMAVELPADVKAIFLAQMLGHIVDLDAIMQALAESDFTSAAEIARNSMGVERTSGDDVSGSVAGSAAGQGLGLGQHLPQEMKAIGANFHTAAEAFADRADAIGPEPSADELQAVFQALAGITHQCRDCHDRFRIR